MLAFAQDYWSIARDADAKDVLGVARDAGRIAVPPGRVDFVDVGEVPVAQHDAAAVGDDAGFFEQLARGGVDQRFVKGIEGAGDRLPEAWTVGPLDEQYFQVGRVDHDQD